MNINSNAIQPKKDLRILGLQIDSKLRWEPHIQKVVSKSASQLQGLSTIAASTWGATLGKTRQIYNATVRPGLTYAASIWYNPKGTSEYRKTHHRKLETIQNKCLRIVTGAFKATNIQILQAKAEIPPIRLHLEKLALTAQAKRGIHEATKRGTMGIRQYLRKRKGAKKAKKQTPAQEKQDWMEKSLETSNQAFSLPLQVQFWWKKKWKEEWNEFTRETPADRRSLVHGNLLGRTRLHRQLRKAESSVAIQMRTEKIGLAEFLYKRHVPGVETASCTCGWRSQNVKHVLLHCSKHDGREVMFREAGSNDLRIILTTEKGLRAATRWMIRCGLLGQFSLAREQLY